MYNTILGWVALLPQTTLAHVNKWHRLAIPINAGRWITRYGAPMPLWLHFARKALTTTLIDAADIDMIWRFGDEAYDGHVYLRISSSRIMLFLCVSTREGLKTLTATS
jgi:hypothetical protein